MAASHFQEVGPEITNNPGQSDAEESRQKLTAEAFSHPNAIISESRPEIQPANSNGVQISDSAPKITGFLQEPGNGVQDLENAIRNAKQSVHMEIYHLTEPGVAQALETAKQNGCDVEVITDASNLAKDNSTSSNKGVDSVEQELQKAGILVTSSSQDFRITHPKTTLIDGNTAYITSMNLTTHEGSFRDFGVSTEDPMIAKDLETIFQADLKNAQNYQKDVQDGVDPTQDLKNAEYTPPTLSPFLFVSPTGGAPDTNTPDTAALSQNQIQIDNALSSLPPVLQATARNDFAKAVDDESNKDQNSSSDQLNAERDLAKMQNGTQLVELFAERMQDDNINRVVGIFDRAKTKVVGETENIGDPDVLNSIIKAATNGVEVDLIIPDPDQSDSRKFSAFTGNKAAIDTLQKADLPNIHIEYMPYDMNDPNSEYMHAKWLVADDGKEGYLGSENYTYSSLHKSREVGIIMENAPQMQQMVDAFNQDWSTAHAATGSDQQ